EVILHAYEEWGTGCLRRFNGMFAFGLWDGKRKRLFLARDRMGVKPLYYLRRRGRLAFASEPKALLGLEGFSRRINSQAMADYLACRYIPGRQSVFEGICRLGPAESMVYDARTDHLSLERYWSLPLGAVDRPDGALLDDFEALLSDVVARQMVSDVPLGVFLSGGLDSSAIACVGARQAAQLNTFSVGFDGWDRTELPLARQTAEKLGARRCEAVVSAGSFEDMQRVFDVFDEPLGDTSIFPTYLICEAARQHVKVALSGDGGDEVFGGYLWHHLIRHCSFRKRLAFLAGSVLRLAGVMRGHMARRCDRLHHYLFLVSPGFAFEESKALFPRLVLEPGLAETHALASCDRPHLPSFQRWRLVDAQTFLVDNNLLRVDRASMAHSLEVRVPYLDHRIVEFAFSLPERLCETGGGAKPLLRRLLERRGLGHLLNQPKRGFSCPVGRYLPPRRMWDMVRGGAMARDGVLDVKAFARLAPEDGSDYRLWLLTALENWYAR
ncbi:MAG TPA: asparagine synthase (glutamine-hydrolyzing), partial [Candidatus Brocadiia bacterium]|nr:asparagine synthase (glutamine-hydrolyzing) [Candidatus Brocadiia bacterium]